MSSGGDVFVGNVAVGIVPSAVGFADKMREAIVPSADDIGAQFGQNFSAKANTTMGPLIQKWGETQEAPAKETGETAGSAFAEAFSAKVKEVADSLPTIELKANATEADATVTELKAKLDELSSKTIGVDLTSTEAMAELDAIKAKMESLKDSDTEIAIGTSVVDWQASIDKVSELRSEAAKPANFVIDTSVANAAESTEKIDALRADADKPADFVIGTSVEGVQLSEDQINELHDNAAKPSDFVIDTKVVGASEATEQIDSLRSEADKPSDMVIAVSSDGVAEVESKLDALRVEADKPIIQKVEIVTTGASSATSAEGAAGAGSEAAGAAVASEASLASGLEKEMEEAGDDSGQGFGQKFFSKVQGLIGPGSANITNLKSGIGSKMEEAGEDAGNEFGGAFSGILSKVSSMGVPLAIAGAAVAVSAVLGEKLDIAQKQLTVTMTAAGDTWDKWSGKVSDAGKSMSQYGYTQDQVDASINSVLKVTGSMSEALGAETTIANIAASQHISLAAATKQYDVALTGAGRSVKQLGIIQASGASQGAAMAAAQKILADQINTAGSMATFAAQHHITLAQATALVTSATGQSAAAQSKLSQVGLTTASATKLMTEAMSGDSAAAKTLAKDHLSLGQVNDLLTQSASGNISAFNKLGIEVLPKSATAAEKYSQVQDILNSKLGGQASAVADTFGGKMKEVEAQLIDAGEAIGMKILPALEDLMDGITKIIPTAESFLGVLGKFVMPLVSAFFTGLGVIFKALTSGPMRDITLAIVGMGVAWVALDAIMAINPFVALGIAIVVLIGVIDKFHTQIISGIVDAFNAVKTAITTFNSWVVTAVGAAWNAVSNTIMTVVNGVVKNSEAVWNGLVSFFTGMWNGMKATATAAWNAITAVFTAAENAIKAAWTTLWGWVGPFFQGQITVVKTVASTILDAVEAVFNAFSTAIRAAWNTIWSWVVSFFTTTFNGIKATASTVINGVQTVITAFVAWMRDAWNTIWTWVSTFFSAQANAVRAAATAVVNAIQAVFTTFVAWVRTAWTTIWTWTGTFFTDSWNTVKSALTAVISWMEGAFTTLVAWIKTAWTGVWNAVSATLTAIWATMESTITTAFNWLRTAFTTLVSWIKTAWSAVWNAVSSTLSAIWQTMENTVTTAFNWLRTAFTTLIAWIKSGWTTAWNAVSTTLTSIWHTMENTITTAFNWIKTAFTTLIAWIKSGWTTGWNAVSSTLTSIWKTMEGTVTTAFNWIKTAFTSALNWVQSTWKTAWNAVSSTATSVWKTITSAMNSFFSGLKSGFTSAVNSIKSIWNTLESVVKAPVAFVVNTVYNDGIVKVVDAIGSIIGTKPLSPISGFAKGTGGAPPGWAWVGEEGPELVKFSGGETVVPHAQSVATGLVAPGFAAGTDPIPGTPAASAGGINQQTSKEQQLVAGENGGIADPISEIGHAAKDVVGNIFKGLRDLAGDALAAAIGTIMNPLISHIPGLNTGFGKELQSGISKMESNFINWIKGNASQGAPVGSSGPAGGATGSEMANGTELFTYLLTNLFGGNAIAAAGATASIWGESTWNPFAQGTGGRGLIGWTPPGTISNANFEGGMRTQLPAIITFVHTSGDEGAIAEMHSATSVFDAANMWGMKVERYGINDVHSTGVTLATQIMESYLNKKSTGTRIVNAFASGTSGAAPGWAMVGEQGMELVNFKGGEQVLSHEQSLAALSQVPGQGYAAGTVGSAPVEVSSHASAAASLKSAMMGVEQRLDRVVKATQNVGSDVGATMNKTGRKAGTSSVYNNVGRH